MLEQFTIINFINNTNSSLTDYEYITSISQHSFSIQFLVVLLSIWIIILIVGLMTGATHAKSGNFWVIWIVLGLLFFIAFILFYTGIIPYNFTLPYG